MCKVLKIKFRTIKSAETANLVNSETKGHLAIRLNDTKVLTSSELIELIEYACKSFGVKYLTIVCGHKGFDKELELANTVNGVNISIYHNFEVVSEHSRPMTLVNLIDVDSQTIFLSKIKAESINQANEAGIVYKSAVDSFTDFPPIDLYLCMTRNLDFTRLYPLQLSFTHFYCCPVLAEQSFSREAITEGFERFSHTKQNFGK